MKIVLFANTDWYLYNFRLPLAYHLRNVGHDVLLVSPSGPYSEKLIDAGFRWISAPMQRRSINPIREINLIFWLIQFLKRERVDLIHGFTIKCALYGSIAGYLANRIPSVNAVTGMGYVYTSDDFLAKLLKPLVTRLMKKHFSRESTKLIVQNSADFEFFTQQMKLPHAQVQLIPGSGVNSSKFQLKNFSNTDGTFKVLLATRLLINKGVHEYLEAAQSLKAQGHAIKFLVAGDMDHGNPNSVAKSLIEQYHAQGVINWLGHQEDMSSILQSVDLVVLPSYREGLPKILIEAASCGLPIVTTNVPGCRDVVEHEVSGLLVPAKDSKELADAILKLSQDPSLASSFGKAARDRALSEFEEGMIIEQTVAVYRSLIPNL